MVRFNLATTTEDQLLEYFRVSTRLDRAVDLVDFVVEEAHELFLVRSQSSPEKQYTVDLRSKSCDCPDWTFRGSVNGLPCKHIMAAYLSRAPETGGRPEMISCQHWNYGISSAYVKRCRECGAFLR